MSVPELLQLYAPLAGMLAMAFWLGLLSERVRGLASRVTALEADSTVAGSPAVIRLQEQVGSLMTAMEKVVRSMEGVQRQLGNLMKNPPHEMDLG